MKPLLVGEANPWQSDAESARYFALHPDPPHASGGRLCFLVMGLDERTYLRRFDRTDLCHPKWSIREAREHAARLMAERTPADTIVLCGRKVAHAFGVGDYHPLTIVQHPEQATLVLIPHPSALNRFWYGIDAIDRVRATLRTAGVIPAAGLAIAT